MLETLSSLGNICGTRNINSFDVLGRECFLEHYNCFVCHLFIGLFTMRNNPFLLTPSSLLHLLGVSNIFYLVSVSRLFGEGFHLIYLLTVPSSTLLWCLKVNVLLGWTMYCFFGCDVPRQFSTLSARCICCNYFNNLVM